MIMKCDKVNCNKDVFMVVKCKIKTEEDIVEADVGFCKEHYNDVIDMYGNGR